MNYLHDRRRALISKLQRLPVEYKEVEYIASYGDAYIDTLVNTSQGIKTELDMDRQFDLATIFGARNAAKNRSYNIITESGNKQIRIDLGSKQWVVSNTNNAKGRYKITFDADIGTAQVVYNNIISDYVFSGFGNLYNGQYGGLVLFGMRNGNTVEATVTNGYLAIYNAKIYENNILIRDFVPCYRKADSKAGMYDIVTNTFFVSQGTGDFTLGPEL